CRFGEKHTGPETYSSEGITVDYGPTTFRFFHSWMEMEGFQNLVVDTWNNDGIVNANGLKDHQKRLSSIDVKIDHGIASEEDFKNRRDSLTFVGALDHTEARDLAQKAKIKWALEGDENTRFFHGTLKKKRRQLAIKGILKNGDWIEEPGLVKAEFLGHFRHRFQQPTGISPTLDTDLLNPLSPSQRDFLERPFSRDEIKRAVWDCNGDRESSPDGLTFKFFTSFWDLIEDDVVSNANPVQSAFIKERNILDGPPILNEVLAWHHQRKKEIMVFKVDFEKAFDSLRWDFLDLILDKLGFGFKWRAWIKGLHALTSKAEALGLFKGPSIGRDNLSISYLMYVDDVIFFGECNVLGVGVTDAKVSHMADIISCRVTKFPFKYLGVSVGCNMARCSNWNAIIQKFSSKLSSWKARLLSVGGRLSLIKSVLGNLPTYYMSIYLMPVSIRKKLESFRNKCFIGGDLDDKKMTWVKWERILASKKDGGIGISSIFELNIGLVFKWIWRILEEKKPRAPLETKPSMLMSFQLMSKDRAAIRATLYGEVEGAGEKELL
nr:RNA-directed DNA polymerase, eukaryota, reverse transcriptase zinc-binding domain protein [Tanacetum cinerariifolium]